MLQSVHLAGPLVAAGFESVHVASYVTRGWMF